VEGQGQRGDDEDEKEIDCLGCILLWHATDEIGTGIELEETRGYSMLGQMARVIV